MSEVISLNKGQVINLSKIPAIDLSKGGKGLHNILVGLGWDPIDAIPNKENEKVGFFSRLFGGNTSSSSFSNDVDIDCDAFAIRLSDDKIRSRGEDIVYYGHLKTSDGLIVHTGDNLTGEGDGDDEQILIGLDKMSCDKIMLAVNIYKGKERKQHFGMLQNAFIRIVDRDTNTELCRYTLDSKYDNYVSIIFGELVKTGADWTFIAKGEPVKANSISEVADMYSH